MTQMRKKKSVQSAQSAGVLRTPHLNGSFPAFSLGWMIAGMNIVLTSALTCFLSLRRGLATTDRDRRGAM
jgi:hypothetical protein